MRIQDNSRYCEVCESLCYPYEQGLCCNCGQPWETERYHEEDYPKEWVKCKVYIELENE